MTTYTPTTFVSDGETYVTDVITTIFTPPAWCSTRPYTFTDNGNGAIYYQRDLALGDTSQWGQLGRTTSCYVENISFHRRANVSGVYLPGVCPLSYTETEAYISDGSITKVQCCPSGMKFDNTQLLPGLCSSVSTVSDPVTVVVGTGSTSTITTNFIAVDWPVMMAWQSKDLPYYTPASAPVLARFTPAPSTSSQSSSSSSSPSPSRRTTSKSPAASRTGTATAAAGHSSQSSLSSGAGAGVGVGVAIAVLALIALIAWLCIRRRKKSKQIYEKVDAGAVRQDPAYEAGSADKYELMQSAAVPLEVDGNSSNRAEMDGHWQGHEMEDRRRSKRESAGYLR